MSDTEKKSIIEFIDTIVSLPGTEKFTWRLVEEKFGFTRQALQAHLDIKAAYDIAKKQVTMNRQSAKTGDLSLIDEEVVNTLRSLQKKIEVLENLEILWKRRWYRIAYNIRQQGIQMVDIDKPVPVGHEAIPAKTVNKILNAFDGDIPPVAKYHE